MQTSRGFVVKKPAIRIGVINENERKECSTGVSIEPLKVDRTAKLHRTARLQLSPVFFSPRFSKLNSAPNTMVSSAEKRTKALAASRNWADLASLTKFEGAFSASEPQQPKSVLTLIREGDLPTIEAQLNKLVDKSDEKWRETFKISVVVALEEVAHLFTSAEKIVMLLDAVPMVEEYVDIRVRENFWRLMRAMFVALPSFETACEAFMGIYRKQNNAFVRNSSAERQFAPELTAVTDMLMADEPIPFSRRQFIGLWLFNTLHNAKKWSKALITVCVQSANAFNTLNELFAPPSPLLAIDVDFNGVSSSILSGLIFTELRLLQLPTSKLHGEYDWRSEAFAHMLVQMSRMRSTEPTAIDASLALRYHAIPLFRQKVYGVALHIIWKLHSCHQVDSINWERVGMKFNDLYSLVASDVPRQSYLTLEALFAMLQYAERHRRTHPTALPQVAVDTRLIDDEHSSPAIETPATEEQHQLLQSPANGAKGAPNPATPKSPKVFPTPPAWFNSPEMPSTPEWHKSSVLDGEDSPAEWPKSAKDSSPNVAAGRATGAPKVVFMSSEFDRTSQVRPVFRGPQGPRSSQPSTSHSLISETHQASWQNGPPVSNDPLDDILFDKYGIPIMMSLPSIDKRPKMSRVKRAMPLGGIELLAVDP